MITTPHAAPPLARLPGLAPHIFTSLAAGGVCSVLRAAALTYVMGIVAAFFILLHFIMILRGNDQD